MLRLLLVLLTALVLGSGSSASSAMAALAVAPASEAAAPRWEWPTASRVVLRQFEAPPTRYEAGHRGVDIATSQGEIVRAVADGVIAFVGQVAGRGVVAIDHPDGYRSSIEPVSTDRVPGERVTAGEAIGVVAGSTHCGSTCVHFGVRNNGHYISPALLWGAVAHPVLPSPARASGSEEKEKMRREFVTAKRDVA